MVSFKVLAFQSLFDQIVETVKILVVFVNVVERYKRLAVYLRKVAVYDFFTVVSIITAGSVTIGSVRFSGFTVNIFYFFLISRTDISTENSVNCASVTPNNAINLLLW